MELLKVECEVSKEAYELAQGLVKFSAAVKTAMADGWQMGQDLPVVIAAAMGDLMPAMQGVDKLGEELGENKIAFAKAFAMSGFDFAEMLAKK